MMQIFFPSVNPFNVVIMPQVNPTTGRSFSLNCSLFLPQWTRIIEKPAVEFLDTDYDMFMTIKMSETASNNGFKYITTLCFTTLQTSHGGQYKCKASFRSNTTEIVTSLIVKGKQRIIKYLFSCTVYCHEHVTFEVPRYLSWISVPASK